MAQRHLDRLSATDASILDQEGDATLMHIGAVSVFAGAPPPIEAFRDHIRARLPLVPRYRQKLAFAPLNLGRPHWVDDPRFNLSFHVRHTALPAPGDDAALHRLVARVFGQRLDRTKPLWELWFVEGLVRAGTAERSSWALISKNHHALVDGVAGADLLTVLFDASAEPGPSQQDAWLPRPEPSSVELAAAELRSGVGEAVALPWRAASGALSAVGALARRGLPAGPAATPLTGPIGPHRRFEVAHASLADLKAVKDAFGATVNDVVLAVVAGALRRFLHARGLPTQGVALRAGVPVSVRARSERGQLGNRLAQVIAPLPVGEEDPAERLAIVQAAMDGLKESRSALGVEAIAGADDFAPPTIMAQASRLDLSAAFDVLVTNVPGPQVALHVLGARMAELYPVPFLAGERTLAVAVMSYDGGVGFGLLSDLDALGDLGVVAAGVAVSLEELLALARGDEPAGLGIKARPRRRPARRAGA